MMSVNIIGLCSDIFIEHIFSINSSQMNCSNVKKYLKVNITQEFK